MFMNHIKTLALSAALLLFSAFGYAQNTVTATLLDAASGEPVGFATVSLTKTGATKPAKYVLSSEKGLVTVEGIKNGEYTFKAELLGYKPYFKVLNLDGKEVALGEVKLELDSEQLDAASVSAVGNPIIIKKDTIEYNATSFKTTENDMLEDLLKKLPGVEIGDDGGITVNGETITKITIDGRTFFLDDPTVASKNLPAKLINKLKVIKKKSEQAEFTGIDDGEEENVIDLSVKPGMMQGLIGNINVGAGKDLPSEINPNNDFRYAGNAFIGRFSDNSNISLILNANNTNNQGSSNRSGGMMGAMMGGGMGMMMGGMGSGMGSMVGGGGINSTEMAGLNIAYTLLDDRMELGGNYMFNHSNNLSTSDQYQKTYLDGYNQLADIISNNLNVSRGHNVGIRLEHEFSENTSIVFEPQINFGGGNYSQNSETFTDKETNGVTSKLNYAKTNNTGDNKNVSTSGMFIFRQRLGIPGRTITAQVRYSFSNNDMVGVNWNNTKTYSELDQTDPVSDVTVDQSFTNNQKSTSLSGRLTYTEPMGNYFYLEGNYSYNYSKSVSEKMTVDNFTGKVADLYSSKVINENGRHEIGANVLFQRPEFRAQIGFSAQPNHTYNGTYSYDSAKNSWAERTPYVDDRWNFAPQAMILWDVTENSNMRIFYRGQSQQPSSSQLMPVPDLTDPLNISFGNPSLTPYFSHNGNVEFRNSNRQKFSSFTVRLNGGLTQNPIVNVTWQGTNGARYSMPFNGKNNWNAGLNSFFNSPIAKSNFSINNNLRLNFNLNNSYVANKVDMSKYPDPMTDYYKFMDAFLADHRDINNNDDFTPYSTNTLNFSDDLRATFRNDAIEITLGGGTSMKKTWYSIDRLTGQLTWANNIQSEVVWTWDAIGLSIDVDYRYRWYRGYDQEQPDRHILNAEITKLLFNQRVTLSVRCSDILGQQRAFTVSDVENYHTESTTNTLGRYMIVSLAYRFGSFGGRNGRGGRGGRGGGMMGGPGMMGGGMMGPPPGRM